jgi:hypothetical protein
MSADLGRDSLLAEQIVAAEPGMARIAPAGRAPYYYALGKVHADRREPALAFPAFARGAQFQKSSSRYDRAAARRNAEEAVYGYSSGGMATITSQQDEQTGRTIFVTGLPRSGTTLVEQILTSHSAVTDGGEIARLDLVAREIGGASFPVLTRYVEGYSLEAITRLWDHWIDQRFPVPGRVVDKTLNNTRLLGLAAAILPEAPLIWVTRDPLDRAWSCFRTFFTGDMAWSYDLEDIAFHFRLEDQLLQRWQEVLGDRLLAVPYEALVTDSARWIRRIIGHCGLTEELQVFVPHENDRPVITASVTQVRQPIHREGIGSAEPYRQFLEPFIAAYGG